MTAASRPVGNTVTESTVQPIAARLTELAGHGNSFVVSHSPHEEIPLEPAAISCRGGHLSEGVSAPLQFRPQQSLVTAEAGERPRPTQWVPCREEVGWWSTTPGGDGQPVGSASLSW